jgi:hypothetical protein
LPASASPMLLCSETLNHELKKIPDLQSWKKWNSITLVEVNAKDNEQKHMI